MRSKYKKTKFDIANLEPHVFVLAGLSLLVVGVGLSSYGYMQSFNTEKNVSVAAYTNSECGSDICSPTKEIDTVLHERYKFSFAYPEGFEISESQNNIIAKNHRGHIWVQVISKELDPENIIGLHGKIDPAEVRVRDINYRQWYRFALRDERCSGPQYQTALGASILAVSFITCHSDNVDEALPIANDWDMIEEFLRSFKTD